MTTPIDETAPVGAPARPRSRKQAPPPPRRDSNAVALGIVALVAALLALAIAVLGVTGVIGRSGGTASSCQRQAWASLPRAGAGDLPTDWSLQGPQYDATRAGATLVGPAADDGSSTAVFVQVTCYGSDASEAIKRTRAASLEAGSQLDTLTTGEEGFRFDDPVSASFGAYFRRGDLVAFVQLAVGAPDSDLTSAVLAVDRAITRALGPNGLDIADPVIPSPLPTDSGASADPGASLDPNASDDPGAAASPAAPDLEALLPATVDGHALEKSSYTGDDLFGAGDTTAGRAVVAALGQKGKKATDFLMAQAEDLSGELPALEALWAFRVKGLAVDAYEPLVLDALLNANISGVKTTRESVGGRDVKLIDYGDGADRSKSYIYVSGDVLYVVTTSDPKLAGTILSGLK